MIKIKKFIRENIYDYIYGADGYNYVVDTDKMIKDLEKEVYQNKYYFLTYKYKPYNLKEIIGNNITDLSPALWLKHNYIRMENNAWGLDLLTVNSFTTMREEDVDKIIGIVNSSNENKYVYNFMKEDIYSKVIKEEVNK